MPLRVGVTSRHNSRDHSQTEVWTHSGLTAQHSPFAEERRLRATDGKALGRRARTPFAERSPRRSGSSGRSRDERVGCSDQPYFSEGRNVLPPARALLAGWAEERSFALLSGGPARGPQPGLDGEMGWGPLDLGCCWSTFVRARRGAQKRASKAHASSGHRVARGGPAQRRIEDRLGAGVGGRSTALGSLALAWSAIESSSSPFLRLLMQGRTNLDKQAAAHGWTSNG